MEAKLNKIVSLDDAYSTTRRLVQAEPEAIEALVLQKGKSEDQFEIQLFLRAGKSRQSEAGLRTQGYFKVGGLVASPLPSHGSLVKTSSLISHPILETKPLITIVTVVYNGEQFLEKTILSVINQTYDNVEYIIIDGFSKDGTIDIIKKYEYAIDYWVSEKDQGVYDAMNKGFDCATGRWVLFLNAGDFLVNNDVIKNAVNIVSNEREEPDLIYGDKHSAGNLVKATDVDLSLRRGGFFACHQSMLFKRNNRYNSSFRVFGDFDLISRMYISGKKFHYVNIPIADYDENGISSKISYRTRVEKLYCVIRYFGMSGVYNSYIKRIWKRTFS